MGANLLFGFDTTAQPPQMPTEVNQEDMQAMVALVMEELDRQQWGLIFPLFILYFLGGYFMYSALFAAVGSAMGDDLGEGQSLTIPITIPVVLAFYIMMVAVQAPHSSLAVWSSLFPLFSPIVMPARLAFDPPGWQIALSVILLLATALFLVWLSGRIYRVGIFMYGKKVTLKELGKWMFYKD
jgi:ABC-2 type transport system permease protein